MKIVDQLSALPRASDLSCALRVDLGRGRAIFAHDVLSHGGEMREFLEAVENHPHLETHIERRSRAGISVSVKGR